MQSNRFITALATALYHASHDAKPAAVKEITGRAAALLAGRRLLRYIPQLFAELDRVRRAAENIVLARVTSARPLSQSSLKTIREYIAKKTRSEVELEAVVDPGVIGGFTVQYGDTLLDATLAHNVKQLANALTANH